METAPKNRSPWAWIPTLYFAQGIPYVIVMTVSVIMYKRMGISNTDIALYTSWLYLPWVIKPLWSPVVELFRTKRFWIVTMQLLVGAGLAGVAFTLPMPGFFTLSLAVFWLLAFASATHDIAADGFYMLGLDKHQQTVFVGIRSTFYRIAMITGQGLLIILAGAIESNTGLGTHRVEVRTSYAAGGFEFEHFGGEVAETDTSVMSILSSKSEVELMPLTIKPSEAKMIVGIAKKGNIEKGFVESEEQKAEAAPPAPSNGWWRNYVSAPLGAWLRENFGPAKPMEKKTDYAGNVAMLYYWLSKPPAPGETVVVNLSVDGDNAIKIAEGSRLEFTAENWNKAAYVVVQLHPNLREETSATLVARSGNIPLAWSLTFFCLTALFIGLFAYHSIILPRPAADVTAATDANPVKTFFQTFALFFRKKEIIPALLFLLLYRFPESQLVKLVSPFLLDPREAGGLGLTTSEVGLVYGTLGLLALTLGGILGGLFASAVGLKRAFWWLVCSINFPNIAFVYLAYAQPESLWLVAGAVMFEQFGYGLGFTAYMLYMIYISEGQFKTAHYAICTGFMALGMMIPGMLSGWLQEMIGYQHFFVWLMIATIPVFIVAALVKVDPTFGLKTEEKSA